MKNIYEFKLIDNLERELQSIFATKYDCEELYWNRRNFIIGNLERVIYKTFINGSEEDRKKVIKKMCKLYFVFNVNLYRNYIMKYKEIFENFNHYEFLLYPIDIKEFIYKSKKIIVEYYLLGQKVYTDKKQFLYGILYFSSNLIYEDTDTFGCYHGDLILGKQLEYMNVR